MQFQYGDSGPGDPPTAFQKLGAFLAAHPRLLRRFIAGVGLAALVAILWANVAQTPETLLASAKALLVQNDHRGAVIQLKNALQKRPNFPEARYLLGRSLLDSGDIVSAEKE